MRVIIGRRNFATRQKKKNVIFVFLPSAALCVMMKDGGHLKGSYRLIKFAGIPVLVNVCAENGCVGRKERLGRIKQDYFSPRFAI